MKKYFLLLLIAVSLNMTAQLNTEPIFQLGDVELLQDYKGLTFNKIDDVTYIENVTISNVDGYLAVSLDEYESVERLEFTSLDKLSEIQAMDFVIDFEDNANIVFDDNYYIDKDFHLYIYRTRTMICHITNTCGTMSLTMEAIN